MKKWMVCLIVCLGISGATLLPAADFDGDGDDDICTVRPEGAHLEWYIRGVPHFTWGDVGDIPSAGDYDGDGTDEPWLYRPSNGRFYFRGIRSQRS